MGLYSLENRFIVHRSAINKIEEIIPVEEVKLKRYIEVGETGIISGGDQLDLERRRRNGEGFWVDCRIVNRRSLPDIEVSTTVHHLPSRKWVFDKMCSLCLPGYEAAERLLKLEGILEPDDHLW